MPGSRHFALLVAPGKPVQFKGRLENSFPQRARGTLMPLPEMSEKRQTILINKGGRKGGETERRRERWSEIAALALGPHAMLA